MHFRRIAFAALTFSMTASMALAQSPQLSTVLNQLDAATARFKSAQANVKYDNYVRVVRDHTVQTGTLFIERSGGGQQMGAVFYDVGPDGKPAKTPAKVLNYDGGTLRIYSPGVNQVDIFKAGANQAKYESFLTLGFGGSGKALQQAWKITDQGPETLNDSGQQVKTEKLDLVSKDPGVVNMFTHVTIWADPARGISLKQIFYAPNGDTRTAEYSNIKLNGSVDKRPYAISKKATPIRH